MITTNLPGCAKTVVDGQNGYLVEPRNVPDLANAIEAFISDQTRIPEMGKHSLSLARERFDVHKINRMLLTEMNLI